MPGRTLLFLVVLLIAATLPYALSLKSKPADALYPETKAPSLLATMKKGLITAIQPSPRSDWRPDPNAMGATALSGRPIAYPQLGGPSGVSAVDLLRFDATPLWISQNWSRVTTSLSDSGLHGMRVAVVTGTEIHDLAGTITYYFNGQRELQRITLYGLTGDYGPLVSSVQQQFGLQQYACPDRSLYLSFLHDRPIGLLQVRTAPVQRAQQSRSRYEIELELNRPTAGATLSSEALRQLYRMRQPS